VNNVLRKSRAYIGFGANLGDPFATYKQAIEIIEAQIGSLVAESRFYESLALTLPGSSAPKFNYTNSCIAVDTLLTPHGVLSELLKAELSLKRSRKDELKWAPRPVDLDLLLLDGEIIPDTTVNGVRLNLPHPELHKRDFVLAPLKEIAADTVHPILGINIAELESTLEMRGFERYVLRVISQAESV
jgi:2-amino-4-hydroxy-6-hydroxymethyldihydropteridine diphosphokinase